MKTEIGKTLSKVNKAFLQARVSLMQAIEKMVKHMSSENIHYFKNNAGIIIQADTENGEKLILASAVSPNVVYLEEDIEMDLGDLGVDELNNIANTLYNDMITQQKE